jgi:hypothetical protein
MARIGILSEHADVTVLIGRLLTPGHEPLTMEKPLTADSPPDCIPDLIVVPLFRKPEAVGRPIRSFEDDVVGAHLLRQTTEYMDGHPRPVIVFGIGVNHDEVPKNVAHHTYLTFPQAIQELSPLISGLVGPAKGESALKKQP